MPARRTSDFEPAPAPNPPGDGLPQITTPVINIQDLEHNANEDTRVNNAGVEVKPPGETRPDRESAEDETARDLVAEFERSLVRLPPG